ncbi:hypothetical protein BN1221_01023 [Brenneria goodwinii]|uniref:Uncharacterized protein n=1 Tax=Brenneria goodwinii TaxID=1109412 RepID=A0A0G4JRU9_9GAMM|nr:hypothetical protein BN1221_01023 [Brenneria goodwinii]
MNEADKRAASRHQGNLSHASTAVSRANTFHHSSPPFAPHDNANVF